MMVGIIGGGGGGGEKRGEREGQVNGGGRRLWMGRKGMGEGRR